MWTEQIGVTPEQWLLSVNVPSSSAPEILGSFNPFGIIKVVRFGPPHTFIRFHSKFSKHPIYRPNYWADGTAWAAAWGRAAQHKGWLTTAEVAEIAKRHYRDLTAISHNWNPLDSDTMWRINLEGNETVEGLFGPAKAQPTHQATVTEPVSTSVLSGGGMQVFLYPGTPFICQPIDWK